MRRHLLFLLGVLGLASASCEPGFDPYNRLTAFRVLAIVADPPTPAPGETTTLSTLLYEPSLGLGQNLPGVQYRWSWCPVMGDSRDGYTCPFDPAELAALTGGTAPTLELGTGPSASFTHNLPVAALQALCTDPSLAAIMTGYCEGGFPIQIKVVVSTASDEIEAVTRLRLRLDPATPPNRRPVVGGLSALIGEQSLGIGVEPGATLPRDKETELRALVEETESETYDAVDDKGGPVKRRERLRFTWFVETGTTLKETTGYDPGADGDPVTTPQDLKDLAWNLENKWRPAIKREYAPNRARLIVVVRDNRGGIGWRDGFVELEETP